MKIAVTSQNGDIQSPVDRRFGRAGKFIIYDTVSGKYSTAENVQNLNAEQGAGIQSAQNLINSGVDCVITGHCGPKAFKLLKAADIRIYTVPSSCNVEDAIKKFSNGELPPLNDADVEGHWV